MINKLLDEPYWEELDQFFEEIKAHKFYINKTSFYAWRHRETFGSFESSFIYKILFDPLSEKEGVLFIDKEMSRLSQRRAWSSTQLKSFILKNLKEIKKSLIHQYAFYLRQGSEANEEFIKKMNSENNMQIIFSTIKNLKYHNQMITDSGIITLTFIGIDHKNKPSILKNVPLSLDIRDLAWMSHD